MDNILKPTVRLEQIIFKGGKVIELTDNDKIIIVGPNNSGKSQTLRDISIISGQSRQHKPLIVEDVIINKNINGEELQTFLDENATFQHPYYYHNDWKVNRAYIHQWNGKYLDDELKDGFIKNITAKERLDICEEQRSISPDEPKPNLSIFYITMTSS